MANAKKGKKMAEKKAVDKIDKSKNSVISKIKNFEGLKKDYELYGDKELITLGFISHKLSETLEAYLELIQQVLQPEEFHALYESAAFNDIDKKNAFDLYKRAIIVHREILKAQVLSSEEKYIDTINNAYKEICDIKPSILQIVDKMQQSWKQDIQKDSHKSTQYFG